MDLALAGYSCFLGKNDTGKSSVLDALNLLFDPSASGKQDLCGIDTADEEEAYVEAHLEDVPVAHPYSREGIVRVRFDVRTSKRYAWGVTPSNDGLKAMKTGAFTKAAYARAGLTDIQRAVVDPIIERFPAAAGKVQPQGWLQAYAALDQAGHVDKEDGWDPISDVDLGQLVVPVILRADLKAAEELSDAGDTALGRVGGFLVRQAAAKHQGLRDANENLKAQIAEVSKRNEAGRWDFEPLNQLEDILKAEIQTFDSAVIVDAEVAPPKLRPLQFSITMGVHDAYVSEISGLGHGLQRTAIFALLRIPQKLGAQEERDVVPEMPLYLFLIEEPELYLHPQAERRRMKELWTLAELPEVQVCVATHSAFFVDMRQYRGISRFSRPERKATSVQQWTGGDLAADDRSYLNAIRFLHPGRSAMLFADRVILVEGPTEKMMIPILAEKMGIDLGDVEVVDCEGVGNLKIFSQILQGFQMEFVVWPDSDRPDKIEQLRAILDPNLARLVIAKGDWESMTGVAGDANRGKPWRSYDHFVVQDNGPNELTQNCIRAAYEWRNFDASAE